MKIEFLPDGSPDCPLLRLFDFDTAEARLLRHALLRLAEGAQNALSLHELLPLEPVGACTLTFQVTEKDHGITGSGQNGVFFCGLRRSSWQSVAERVTPFCIAIEPGTYQWLDESVGIPWLLSPDGCW